MRTLRTFQEIVPELAAILLFSLLSVTLAVTLHAALQ